MSEIRELKASPRQRVGKGAARAARREGLVPCIIYGENKEPEAIAVDSNVLRRQVHSGRFQTTLYDIDVGGEKVRVLPRDIQFDPVRDFPLHVDFLRLAADSKIAVEIPVHFINEENSPGLKRGGVLNIVRHEIELECPAAAIPDEIVIDLTGLEIGDSLHVSSVTLPAGAVPTITDRDFTIATIAAPAGLGAEEEEGEKEEGEEGAVSEAAEGGEGEAGEGGQD
jgi:large subunit ribosomal protein L25